MQTKLGSWSWQQLHAMYKIYAEQMEGYADIADRFELPLPVKAVELAPGDIIPVADTQHAKFVQSFLVGVNRINAQLKVLDREIARRNKLIGVMG